MPAESDRKAYLKNVATQWSESDPDPIAQEAAALVDEHDDREQFLAGVEIFLRGIAAAGR
jgi:hypothetical protein